MISGTTRSGSLMNSKQLINKKVPQRKSIAAGSGEQDMALTKVCRSQFSTDDDMVHIPVDKPNYPKFKR